MNDLIVIKGAKENNLKNIDLTLPRNKLIVFSGVSGSGKSTLAFDTIFAEGQRRYMESLSSYARQFLGQMKKPNVESIDGLSPAISINQKTTSHNPRSTVGTVTEIYDYLRLFYARVGTVFCPNCGREIEQQTVDQICDKVIAMPEGSRIYVNAPIARGKKGEFQKEFLSYKKSGFLRVEVDGIIYNLDEDIKLDKNVKHNISVVVDRLIIKEGIEQRLSDSIETALKLADGLVVIECDGKEQLFSTKYSCPDCGTSIEEIEPRLFSFNNPFGACPSCHGLGYKREIDKDKVIKDQNLSLRDGAVRVSGWNLDTGKMAEMYFEGLAEKYGFSLDVPFKDLSEEVKDIVLYGSKGEKFYINFQTATSNGRYFSAWEGIIPNLQRRYHETTSEYTKSEIERYMKFSFCSDCQGKRLKKEALSVRIGGLNIAELCDMSVTEVINFLDNLQLSESKRIIANSVLKEIKARLNFLKNVGLDYLTLSRSAESLSGGEAQRIRLATQIGSGLTGVLYILDEPSIGLHQRDNEKLLYTLKNLRDLGNTLVVVEHDEEHIREADYIVDIGPKAGVHGGEVVVAGTLQQIMNCKQSLTGDYLAGRRRIEIPAERKKNDGRWLKIKGAKQNNLKNIDVDFPVGVFTCVTGVSGSGKSSLVNEIIYPYLANKLNRSKEILGNVDEILGIENFDNIINIDQSPIGRTPRSNPATYTGVFAPIRDLFAMTNEAKERGYKSGRFSFNVAGGRCEHCEGDGVICIEMHFLPDVYVPCEVCKGTRYNRETLQVTFKGKNISEVLDMTVDEGCDFFEKIPSVYNKLKTLQDVGLGYIKLGQSSTTLSGGESQRVKLATELAKRSTGRTLYILDEPTTGLHPYDVDKLCKILQRLRDGGNTVIVIEHNLDVIKIADYIVDLGPEGGNGGGTVVATGTPEEIADNTDSFTGVYLKKVLKEQ